MYYERRRLSTGGRRKKYRFNKKFVFFASVVGAFIILLLVFLFLFTDIGGGKLNVKKLDVNLKAQVTSSQTMLYSLSGSTVTAMDFSGKEQWNVKFSSSDLTLTNSNELICVYNGTTANVLSADKEHMFSVEAKDYKIVRAVCGHKSIAILTQSTTGSGDNKVTQYDVRIFDSEGKELYRANVADGEIVNFDFYGDDDNLWMLTLVTSGVQPISRLTTIDPAQQALTGIVDLTDQLITDVFFTDENIYLSGTTNVAYYDLFNEKLGDILIYGLKCIDHTQSADSFVLLYAPRQSDTDFYTSLRILSKDDLDTTMQLPENIFSAALSADKVYCFTKNTVYTYKFDGEYQSTMDLEIPITGVKKLSDSYALLTSADGLYLMSLS